MASPAVAVSGKLYQRLIDDLSHPPKLTWGDVTKPGCQILLPGVNTRVRWFCRFAAVFNFVECCAAGLLQHGTMVFVDAKGQLIERALRSGSWNALPKTPLPHLPASNQRQCVVDCCTSGHALMMCLFPLQRPPSPC